MFGTLQQLSLPLLWVKEKPGEDFPGVSDGKEFTCNAGDLGLIPGSERFIPLEKEMALQHSCLENPMDREAWQATAHGVTKGGTQLSD